MKIANPPVIPAVMLMPEEISMDCPRCDASHVLTRGLDFDEDRDGIWRLTERPGLECDCGALLVGDFTLAAESPERPSIPMPSGAGPQGATSRGYR